MICLSQIMQLIYRKRVKLDRFFVLHLICFGKLTLAKNLVSDDSGGNQLGSINDPISGNVDSEFPEFEKFTISPSEFLAYVTGKGGIDKRSTEDCEGGNDSNQCDPGAKYRTADGTCNNLEHPLWGSAGYCETRLLDASYEDGESEFRVSVDGSELPAARHLSRNLHEDKNRTSNYWNHLYVFFGQLVAHDMVLTTNSDPDGDCCSSAEKSDEACKPILVSKNDPFYKKFNVTCLSFERTKPCNCDNGPKQLYNEDTSFIDASFVYGSSEDLMQSLRKDDGSGELKIQESKDGKKRSLLLPSDDAESDGCSFADQDEVCFRAGENRVNQHTTLTCLQTIFMRQHNSIAKQLAQINPHWDEDKLFYETRRIVGGQIQVIVYKEYLPLTLGDAYLSHYRLKLSNTRTKYNSSLNPTIAVEFSSAVFRFAHSMIYKFVTHPLDVTQGRSHFKNLFERPFGLYKGECGPLLEATTRHPAQMRDRHMDQDVTNYLLRHPGQDYGSDLAATDIHRGRDNGLEPYVKLVSFCTGGKTDIKDFSDLSASGLMNQDNVDLLQKNYKDVQDVDAWTGMLMERHASGSVVGPTTACFIAIQFYLLKYGDRFYFEHEDQAGSFTDDQLKELKKTLLSIMICTNTNARSLPKHAMYFASDNNPETDCKNVTPIDLSAWKEQTENV